VIRIRRAHWRVVALRAAAALVFALAALIRPELTLTVLVLIFGAYAFVDGVLALVLGLWRFDDMTRWWVMLLEGVTGIAFGTIAFVRPGATTLAVLYLVAAWAFVTGVLEMFAAVSLRRIIAGERALMLGGFVSVLLSVLLILRPAVGTVALMWMIGGYALIFGILLAALALRLRRFSA
jgi:uncharacterized membrane protein HdeD (DUF308 family)